MNEEALLPVIQAGEGRTLTRWETALLSFLLKCDSETALTVINALSAGKVVTVVANSLM